MTGADGVQYSCAVPIAKDTSADGSSSQHGEVGVTMLSQRKDFWKTLLFSKIF